MSCARCALFLACLLTIAGCGSSGDDGDSTPPSSTNITLGAVTFDTTRSQNLSLNAMKLPSAAASLSYAGTGTIGGRTLVGATITYTQALETVRGVPSVRQTWTASYADGSSDPARSLWVAYATNGAIYAIRHSTTTGFVDMTPALDTPDAATVGTTWVNEFGKTCTIESTTATTDTGWTGCILVKSVSTSGGDAGYVWHKPDLGEVCESDNAVPANGTWRIDLQGHTVAAPRGNG